MKKERVVLSFIAILIGLIAAGVVFYFYQMTKTVPPQKDNPIAIAPKTTPTPTPDSSNFLSIETPQDEQVFSKRVITVTGKTTKNSTIIVSTEDGDDVVSSAANGDFTLTETIPDNTSLLHITAIFPNGEEKKVTRTVTFSTENF